MNGAGSRARQPPAIGLVLALGGSELALDVYGVGLALARADAGIELGQHAISKLALAPAPQGSLGLDRRTGKEIVRRRAAPGLAIDLDNVVLAFHMCGDLYADDGSETSCRNA